MRFNLSILNTPLDDVEVVSVISLRDDVLALRDLPVEHGVQNLVQVLCNGSNWVLEIEICTLRHSKENAIKSHKYSAVRSMYYQGGLIELDVYVYVGGISCTFVTASNKIWLAYVVIEWTTRH